MSVPELVKPTIAQVVREMIANDLSIQDALQRGYANVSGIAKLIKPKVDEILGRRTKLDTLVTSVKRVKTAYRREPIEIQEVIARSMLSVRTDLAKLSIGLSEKALATVTKMLAEHEEEFIQVSKSLTSLTLVFDQILLDEIKSLYREDDILESESDLAAIIVHSPTEIIKTPGCIAALYNCLSRRHINIEDTVSCYTDTIMVVRMDHVGKAFQALTELITHARTAQRLRRRRKQASNW